MQTAKDLTNICAIIGLNTYGHNLKLWKDYEEIDVIYRNEEIGRQQLTTFFEIPQDVSIKFDMMFHFATRDKMFLYDQD